MKGSLQLLVKMAFPSIWLSSVEHYMPVFDTLQTLRCLSLSKSVRSLLFIKPFIQYIL